MTHIRAKTSRSSVSWSGNKQTQTGGHGWTQPIALHSLLTYSVNIHSIDLYNNNRNPPDKAAWKELLHFGPAVFAKPKRGGANINLSNIINRRIAEWDKEGISIVHPRCSDGRKSGNTSEDSKLAAAVANKLEAGNFRAAIRIICSSDTPVEPNQDTLMKLKRSILLQLQTGDCLVIQQTIPALSPCR